MQRSPPPTFEDLGLPREGGQMALDLGGTHAPGANLEFEVGVYDGEAAINRHYVWSLWVENQVVDTDEASVGSLRAGECVRLGVRLPKRAPANYRLRLTVSASDGASTAFLWPVTVPEQRVEARLVIEPASLERGATFTATLRNEGPTEIMTGVDFALERRVGDTWEYVDPFDGDESRAWAALGLLVAPGSSLEFRVEVPRLTLPGKHRMIKTVSAETARVDELRVVAEFIVTG
jgi:hypothetical protein